MRARLPLLPLAALVLLAACDDGGEDAATLGEDAAPPGTLADAARDLPDAADARVAPSVDAEPGEVRDGAPRDAAMGVDAWLCAPGSQVCLSPSVAGVCRGDGAGYATEACPRGGACLAGACVDPVCDPNAIFCREGERFRCRPDGTTFDPQPCADGFVCIGDAECVDAQPNVVVLVDTSTSMNLLVDRAGYARDCLGEGCPPWSFPQCEDPASPVTRLGRVKQALRRLFAADEARGLRVALQRFPQERNDHPDCDTGYAWGRHRISAHQREHVGAGEAWFTGHLDEIIAVPFGPERALARDDLQRWVDHAEAVAGPVGACATFADCPSGVCLDGRCRPVSDPELRGTGFTPLGTSLFYAGEYLREAALVEGRACGADADCGSPHHTCVLGACRDPLATCRPNVVLVFTDGGETDDRDLTDFFHPRVQAKRLHYGLGCGDDADCSAGATCVDADCRPPPGAVDEEARVCSVFGTACAADGDCANPCGAQGCPNPCLPMRVTTVDDASPRLRDAAGNPISVTVHVVDASGVDGGNRDIAAYGGGTHISVDLLDVDALVRQVTPLLDTKRLLAACPALRPAAGEGD